MQTETVIAEKLIYYPDSEPGITRRRQGRGFSYIAVDGTRIDNGRERKRLAALAVPPAYEDVWISPKINGHLQATGRDSRDRKQYRYHPDFRAAREADKYDHLADFGQALPGIRRKLRDALHDTPGTADYAVAAVIALLDRLAIRIGNQGYAEENGTYGATTLRQKHIRFDGDTLHLRYPAKGGKKVKRAIRDKTLNRTLGRLHDLPGATLINWLDADDHPRGVTSDQVNARLAAMAGQDGITAKTFRTWAGSEAALHTILASDGCTIKAASEAAAERLANTPTIARKSYIHPAVIALCDMDGASREKLIQNAAPVGGLRKTEQVLLHLLRK